MALTPLQLSTDSTNSGGAARQHRDPDLMDELKTLLPIYRTVMRLTWRLEYPARHRDELAQHQASNAQHREIRRQEWHLRRRGFRPCAEAAECSMWIRGRRDRVYCSSACRQAAYRRRVAELRR